MPTVTSRLLPRFARSQRLSSVPLGQEITLNVHGPGECFDVLALPDSRPRSTGAVALERTVAYTLPRDDFLSCLEHCPQVVRRILELLADRLRHITACVESLAFLTCPGGSPRRCPKGGLWLLELADRYGVKQEQYPGCCPPGAGL